MIEVGNPDVFKAFCAKIEKEEADLQNRLAKRGTGASFENIQWVGLEQNVPHIMRVIGNPPEFKKSDYDALELYISSIKDDLGARMSLRLPIHAEDLHDEHVIWRLLQRLNEVTWVKDETGKNNKVYKHAKSAIFNKISKGGFSPDDGDSYKYAKSWGGQRVTIINVIDREDDWCKVHKHTKLLSKRVQESGFADVGVPSYGFLNGLSSLNKTYGTWDSFDIQITKTGQKTNPYIIKNATLFKQKDLLTELDASKVQFISLEPSLTEEEQQYDTYPIHKIYRPTKYRDLVKRLGISIREVDSLLNTHFYDEVQSLAEKEQEEEDEKKAQLSENATVVEKQVEMKEVKEVQEQKPTATRSVPTREAKVEESKYIISKDDIALLKGWDSLTEEEKMNITGVEKSIDGKLLNIHYSESCSAAVACPDCNMPAPNEFMSCPGCGMNFS